jgi:broad specificity phosphatase PhoE
MNHKLKKIPFFFLRHGQTEWNRLHRLMGKKDIPLNELGIQQAHQAAQHLKDLSITHIVASPLLRAKQTAEIINEYLDLPLSFHEDLKECCWGVMEGVTIDQTIDFHSWITTSTPKGGESILLFQSRVIQALNTVLDPNQSTLIVSHGGVYWAIMKSLGYANPYADNCIPYHFRSPTQENHPWSISPVHD